MFSPKLVLAPSPTTLNSRRRVTVCSACLTASCWQGTFPCDHARRAGTQQLTVAELAQLGREHPSHYR